MTTQEKIDAIITEQYNDWKGTQGEYMRKYHTEIRNTLDDDGLYLEFLERLKLKNPRPVYRIPVEFFNLKS